ncbi:MAG: 50S ribosomal protein L17 [Candidatus Wildermuthbacteria bacterium]|nr:50S ribosomal protein L17 [Candidatus Wildermuthbacteria bacterium]
MRKRVEGKKFSRKAEPRRAFLRSLARALLVSERITTTETRGKELARLVERLVTKARKGGVLVHRELARSFDPPTVKKLMNDIAPRYKERPGGYTRVIKLTPRSSDGAKMVIVEFVK